MDAYIYRAALLCEDCATLRWHPHHREQQHDDPDCCPQGPHLNGGGEADSPQSCDDCGVFLENPLTIEGERYVGDVLIDCDGDFETLRTLRMLYPEIARYADEQRVEERLDAIKED